MFCFEETASRYHAKIISVLGPAPKATMDAYRMYQQLEEALRFMETIKRISRGAHAHAGGGAGKQNAKNTDVGGASEATSAPPDAEGSGSGDDDDADGDGDGDGPRRHPFVNHASPPSPPRAAWRSFIPKFLTRHAFAWLIALALLLAYLAPPSFAVLFVQLGHPELAKEMLRYQPRLLMPLPSGWSTSG